MTEYRVTSILATVTEPNAVNQIPDLKDFSDKINLFAKDGWKLKQITPMKEIRRTQTQAGNSVEMTFLAIFEK